MDLGTPRPYTVFHTTQSKVRHAADPTKPLVPFLEFPDGFDEDWTDGSSYVTRSLGCMWADREQFVLDMIGDAVYTSQIIQRSAPETDFQYTDYYVRSAKFIGGRGWPGRDPDNGGLAFFDSGITTNPTSGAASRLMDGQHQGLAVYSFRFERPFYPILTDAELAAAYPNEPTTRERFRYTYLTCEPGGSSYQAPKGLLKFEGDPDSKPVTELAPLFQPEALLTLHWYMVPVEVFDVMIATDRLFGRLNTATNKLVPGFVGSVNSTPPGTPAVRVLTTQAASGQPAEPNMQLRFDGRWPAETLLGMPPKIEPYQAGSGKLFHNWQFPFAYKVQGWQRFLRDDDTFRRLVRIPTPTEGPFPRYDFRQIFNTSLV